LQACIDYINDCLSQQKTEITSQPVEWPARKKYIGNDGGKDTEKSKPCSLLAEMQTNRTTVNGMESPPIVNSRTPTRSSHLTSGYFSKRAEIRISSRY
jgi:hypothetical protein